MKSLRLSVGFLCLLLSLGSGFANTFVRFDTTMGDFEVELFDSDKPVTVKNFLRYVQGGYYSNMFFHRVSTNGISIIQGGGFRIVDRGTTNAHVESVPAFAPIKNEARVGKFYSNVYGTIAMAKTSDPNSATSQFFFNLADNSTALDDTNNAGGFTVFGRVITGTNALNHFLLGETNALMKQVNAGTYFTELPVRSYVTTHLTFDDLIYGNLRAVSGKAAYNGLFGAPVEQTVAGSGFITVATAWPKLSGSLRLGALRYSFSGSFDATDNAVLTATCGKNEPLVLRLSLDAVLGSDRLVGSLTSTQWVANVQVDRAAFDARTHPATGFAGQYTLTLPSSGQLNAPGGYGFATVTVSSAGMVTLKGSLAEGTPFSQSVPLSADGSFPLYASLYGGGGYILGSMSFMSQGNAELHGSLFWVKPQSSKGTFPEGFAEPITAVGGGYSMAKSGINPVGSTQSFIFGGDSSIPSFTNSLLLQPGNRLLNTSPNKLTVTWASSSGLFNGTVKPPGSAQSIPFKGVVWQHVGYGYFLDAGESGWVLIQP